MLIGIINFFDLIIQLRFNFLLHSYRHVYIINIAYRSRYEDELIERIVVPYTQHVDIDPDITIRTVTANLLIDLCLECDTKRCIELLDILEKVLELFK